MRALSATIVTSFKLFIYIYFSLSLFKVTFLTTAQFPSRLSILQSAYRGQDKQIDKIKYTKKHKTLKSSRGSPKAALVGSHS